MKASMKQLEHIFRYHLGVQGKKTIYIDIHRIKCVNFIHPAPSPLLRVFPLLAGPQRTVQSPDPLPRATERLGHWEPVFGPLVTGPGHRRAAEEAG